METTRKFKTLGNLIIADNGQRFPVEHIASYWESGGSVMIITTAYSEPRWSFKTSIEDFEEAYREAYQYSRHLSVDTYQQ